MRSTFLVGLSCAALTGFAQPYYFPPLVGATWDTISPASLGWCQHRVDSLIDFLDQSNTKGFIILKDGRIAIEHYTGTFTQDSLWYWASAGKTLTAFLVGQAQEQGYLAIDDSTSQYLGAGWTSLTPQQEGAITIRHQLTMTTGLDDSVQPDNDCTLPACLQYMAAPGSRWAYHNAPYTLLRDVLSNATGLTPNQWTNQQVGSRIGMAGLWFNAGWNNVYLSTVRGMARFGLLLLNEGVWATDTLLHDQAYFTAMTTPSQGINDSYGYLTWLNGQASFMLPGLQFQFPGPLNPSAPPDLFAALGKNDQKIHVVPSQGLVVVRMGNSADTTSLVPITFDVALWDRINALSCGLGGAEMVAGAADLVLYPSPARDVLRIGGMDLSSAGCSVACQDAAGRIVLGPVPLASNAFDIAELRSGAYVARITSADGSVRSAWFVKE